MRVEGKCSTIFSFYSPILAEWSIPEFGTRKMAGLIVLAAAIIAGLRLARDARAGHKSERVIYAVEDAIFLANELYDHALSRFGGNLFGFTWGD